MNQENLEWASTFYWIILFLVCLAIRRHWIDTAKNRKLISSYLWWKLFHFLLQFISSQYFHGAMINCFCQASEKQDYSQGKWDLELVGKHNVAWKLHLVSKFALSSHDYYVNISVNNTMQKIWILYSTDCSILYLHFHIDSIFWELLLGRNVTWSHP